MNDDDVFIYNTKTDIINKYLSIFYNLPLNFSGVAKVPVQKDAAVSYPNL